MRRSIACAVGLAMVLMAGQRAPRAAAGSRAGLASLFDLTTGVVRDTNGDGIADRVAARVILPAAPTDAEIEAATNLAARLGYETTALTLPLVLTEGEVTAGRDIALPILVGAGNRFVKELVARGALDITGLQPGQGLVAAVTAPLGGPDGVAIVGGDDEGTLAAAVQMAARLPRAWTMTGLQVPAIAGHLADLLQARGITASATVAAIVVDRDRRGLASVRVRADVAPGDVVRAADVLQEVDRAHARGGEPATLNYANIAETQVDLIAGGAAPRRVAIRRSGLNLPTLTPPIDPDELAPDSPGERGRPAEAVASSGKTFDLRALYTLSGWYGDAYVDLIPDRTDTTLVLGDGRDVLPATLVAARLGLETTGITLPLTRRAAKVKDPAREANPILVGLDNVLTKQLIKIGRVPMDGLAAGDGVVQVVPRAFGAQTATVIAGADAAGLEAAARFTAARLPYVWEASRGALRVDHVAEEVSRFLAARTGAGQASLALAEIDAMVAELKEKELESVDATVFLEAPEPAFDALVTKRLQAALPGVKVAARSRGITDPVPVFDETTTVPWEVDEVRARIRDEVLPKVVAGRPAEIEVRVSESPAVRQALAAEIREQLMKAGAAAPAVTVRSAYKQGFSWLTEDVIPALKGKPVTRVAVTAARLPVDLTKKSKFYEVPSRWIHELYPVDEIFHRELGLGEDGFVLELAEGTPADTYVVEARDAGGQVVLRAAFSPKVVEREYLDKFPGWARVHVTTGWLTARVGGATVVDARIATDPERFWDHYQAKVLPRVYDHVMKVTDGRPLPDKQPFFRDFDIELRMSEPDFRIGVDEELVSSLEALHEDLYFVTLDFFDALGRTTVRRRLAAPGKVFPIIHPERPGQAGTARVLFAGNAATKPRVEIAYEEKGAGKPARMARDVTRADVGPASVPRAVVRADQLRELEVQAEAKDDREAGRAVDALDALEALHAAGAFRQSLSYARVARLLVTITLKDVRTARAIPFSGDSAPSRAWPAPAAAPPRGLVTWDRSISPERSEEIVGQLAHYPEVRAYRAGRSYRGRDISVMEITLPPGDELVSVPKLTAYKPTLFITGRQHANEVSSTSHILRLAELLVTDPAYKRLLTRMNVVVHPVENPDGAALHDQLQRLTPTHMLHAGRYSALGMDVASQVGEIDPLLPEARVRGDVWQQWLPDIYLNPHGYPSHEWVQPFAGYVPPGFRTYWSTRGWYTGISPLRDPRYPAHAEVAAAIRELVVREVNSQPDVRDMNLRHQARYRRWAYGFAPYVFDQEIYRDTAIYYTDRESGEVRGSWRAGASRFGGGGGRPAMSAWPQVTYFNGSTETPDETAQGAWLDLVTKPGFSYLMASVRFLETGQWQVENIEEDGPRQSVSRTRLRVRPVRPAEATTAPPPSPAER